MYAVKHHYRNDPEQALLWIELYPAIDSAEEIDAEIMRYTAQFFARLDDEWYKLDDPELFTPAFPSVMTLDCLPGMIMELIDVEEFVAGVEASLREQGWKYDMKPGEL